MAAESMQDIKRRIKTVESTEHITNAMKLVSSSKFKRAKDTYDKTNEYLTYVTESIAQVMGEIDEVDLKEIVKSREIKTICYIIVTSDRGMCGGYNNNVIKEAEKQMAEDGKEHILFTIGSKGTDHFRKRGYNIMASSEVPADGFSFVAAKQMMIPVMLFYERARIDEIRIVYTRFVNSLHQEVLTRTLLPFDEKQIKKFALLRDMQEVHKPVHYEPSVKALIDYLMPEFVYLSLYRQMMESNVCEHTARRSAMENATQNAREMLDYLSQTYNRARQAAITNELIEIVSGAEALR